MPDVNATHLAAALNLANAFRAEAGVGPLSDLPAGRRASAAECILARAFNFECQVGPFPQHAENDEEWGVYFPEERMAEAALFARHAGTKAVRDDGGAWWEVPLPNEIGEVANLFDGDELDKRYYV